MTYLSRRGQFTLEMMMVFILVGLAILGMGTYMVRAINAYFKTSEDAIQDSFKEEILPAKNTESPDCVCGPVNDYGCDVDPCQPWERKRSPNCSPTGCSGGAYCVLDRENCCGKDDEGCNTHGCANGQRAWDVTCAGEPFSTYICENDSICEAKCLPPDTPLGPNATWCKMGAEDAGPQPSGMTVNTTVTYVAPGECAGVAPAGYCEAVCSDPFVPENLSGAPGPPFYDCWCPPGFIYVPPNCVVIPERFPTCNWEGTWVFCFIEGRLCAECTAGELRGVCLNCTSASGTLLDRGFHVSSYRCHKEPDPYEDTPIPYCNFNGAVYLHSCDSCQETDFIMTCNDATDKLVNLYPYFNGATAPPPSPSFTTCYNSGGLCDCGGGNDPHWWCNASTNRLEVFFGSNTQGCPFGLGICCNP